MKFSLLLATLACASPSDYAVQSTSYPVIGDSYTPEQSNQPTENTYTPEADSYNLPENSYSSTADEYYASAETQPAQADACDSITADGHTPTYPSHTHETNQTAPSNSTQNSTSIARNETDASAQSVKGSDSGAGIAAVSAVSLAFLLLM